MYCVPCSCVMNILLSHMVTTYVGMNVNYQGVVGRWVISACFILNCTKMEDLFGKSHAQNLYLYSIDNIYPRPV